MTTSPPHRTPVRSGWLALSVTVAARAALAVLCCLLAWSTVPALLGWHTTVVMTGSMLPRLVPGDVVVSRPVSLSELTPGQVLLVDNPDHAGQLRLHRFVRVATDGRLILRGDANPSADSSPVARSAVRGVASLRIPKLGAPFLWASQKKLAQLALTALALIALLACAFWWRPRRLPADPPADVPADDAPPTDTPTPRPAAAARRARPPLTPFRRALLVTVAAAAIIVVTAGGADAAALRMSARTATPSGAWVASTYFSCANAVTADSASFALPLSEAGGSTAVDISGNGANGTYSGGVTHGVAGPCQHDNRAAATLNGTSGEIVGGNSPAGSAVALEIWFKTSGSHGGVLMSLTNNGVKTKLALAMNADGTLVFAVGSSAASITTARAYNDNAWHLAVATVSSGRMALYVDLADPVASTAATDMKGVNGTVHIGYGNHTGLDTGSNDYFQGSVAFAAGYGVALSSAQVAAHYAAAT